MKFNTVKNNITIVIITLYGAHVYADNLTAEELTKSIVKIQKTEPTLNPNTREGESAYAEWTAKKDMLIQQISNKKISGTCVYKGEIKIIEGQIECQSGNITPQTAEYQLCAYKATEQNRGRVAQLALSRCGPSPSREIFSLSLNSKSNANIKKLYNNDKIKFSGNVSYCNIFYAGFLNERDVAKFECKIEDANADLIK